MRGEKLTQSPLKRIPANQPRSERVPALTAGLATTVSPAQGPSQAGHHCRLLAQDPNEEERCLTHEC